MKSLHITILFLLCTLMAYGQKDAILFNRIDEPKEKAFSLMVPHGWILEGGALRLLDPNIAGVSNMVDCKFDLSVKKDAEGSVMIRWLPEMLCIDQSQAWGNPEGAIFNNTLVRRKRDPVSFIIQVAIPYAHANSTNVKVIGSKALPDLATRYSAMVDPSVMMVTNMTYQAAIVEFTYNENGRDYRERMVTVIEDYGRNGAGMWKNRETMLIRTPAGELSKWEPVLQVIQNSGIWNIKWIAGEVDGQRKRAGQIAATQQELNELDKAINENRNKTYSEINKDMYLTLTGQDDYINPFTGKPERDTDNWKNRWVDELGNIIYTDNSEYDPNIDPSLNISGFKRSTPKK